jgi:hypothetical protein
VPREALLHHAIEDRARADKGLVHRDEVGWEW